MSTKEVHKKPEPKPTAIVKEGGLTHRSKARGLLNTDNLPALQNLLKRQPEAYLQEFQAQWNHYQSLRSIFAADLADSTSHHHQNAAATPATVPRQSSQRASKDQQQKLVQLISFVTQLAPSYPEVTSNLPDHLSDLLLNHHSSLTPDIRNACLRSLVLLRNRDVISSEQLLRSLFPLLSITTSASQRATVQSTILSDIKNANQKSKNHRLNRVVQGLLFGIVQNGMTQDHQQHLDPSSIAVASGLSRQKRAQLTGRSEALWAVRLAADLWRKSIWNDSKTVSLLALACFHPHPKVQSSAVRFFLGDLHHAEDGVDGEDGDEDSQDEPTIPDVSALLHARKVNKKTRSGDKKLRAAAALAKKRKRAKELASKDSGGNGDGNANFAALYLLNDAQNFGEKLFDNLSRGDKEKRHSIETKVRIMQLLARVMSAHKLCVLSFYSYVVKYLVPHQPHITLILVSIAQSVHDQTPPDVLTPVLRKLSDSFIHSGVSSEVVAAGLNCCREICRRQPWCMEETLLEDLVSYRKSKDKGVNAAARGILALYREVNPALLKKKERGKAGTLALLEGRSAAPFGSAIGEVKGIEGLELLEKHIEEQRGEGGQEDEGEDGDEGWDGWELEEDDDADSDNDSDGWIAVSSDEDGEGAFQLSDDSDDSDGEEGEGKVKKSSRERLEEFKARRRAERQRKREKAERKREREERRQRGEEVETGSEDEETGSESEVEGLNEEEIKELEEAKRQAEEAQNKISELAMTKVSRAFFFFFLPIHPIFR
ncbi:hypothetical protein IE53DRAFT_400265 [Violaceomyces palustris]|uniref:Uncharacterized protein n=1 Tax=Violaceomyces palustris TaxID=1673888 RepID=A0ACD0NR34_9BASI|nr:hypothetical protein IE53DRAFT_400265 [Violaceomyces palustris]